MSRKRPDDLKVLEIEKIFLNTSMIVSNILAL